MPDPEPSCTILCEAPAWRAHLPAISHNTELAVQHTVARFSMADAPICTLILCDNAAIQALNADWREKNSATNVLSFPTAPMPVGFAHLQQSLGDVYVAFEVTQQEADSLGISLLEHATHLIIHGLLHLLGHDHQTDAERTKMERHEIALLACFDYDNPYNDIPLVE